MCIRDRYTLYQMIADGSAEGYLTTGQKGSWYQIPYSEFLGRAQYYFADGANVSLKETRYYREEDKSMLFSTAQLPELTGERPAFDDPAENGGYCLVSVHRDLMLSLIHIFTAPVMRNMRRRAAPFRCASSTIHATPSAPTTRFMPSST